MREIQFAFRRLLKRPMQLSAGILAFMLGIGVNTATFPLADALLFHPLDLPALDSLVIRVSPNDFWSLSSVSILLALVAGLAMYIPARRAMQMDLATALRHD